MGINVDNEGEMTELDWQGYHVCQVWRRLKGQVWHNSKEQEKPESGETEVHYIWNSVGLIKGKNTVSVIVKAEKELSDQAEYIVQ